MDKIITPDCPQCHGEGSVPFFAHMPGADSRPCGQCIRRYDLANPTPSPRFMATNMTMAQVTTNLRAASDKVRGALEAARDPDRYDETMDDLEWLLGAAADFIASHDPSTKVRLSEAESPYCVRCECDHVPGKHI